jgi:uncharacterized protein YjbI with pentapeptide repeats
MIKRLLTIVCILLMGLASANWAQNDSSPQDAAASTLPEVFAPGKRLINVKLYHSDLSGKTLRDLDLTRAQLVRSRMDHALIKRVKLNRANLNGVNLLQSKLSDVTLQRASLMKAHLDSCLMDGVDLSWADLRHASLTYAQLKDTSLRGAHLEGANLTGVDLSQVNLKFARYDNTTVFPAGFTPKGKGMIFNDPLVLPRGMRPLRVQGF